MSKFTLMINTDTIAAGVATLLNKYNNLRITHTNFTILNNNVEYLVERRYIDGKITVVGCVGIESLDKDNMLIKHLCVDENFRQRGLAQKLIESVLNTITTKFIYMRIKSSNFPSLSLAEKLGFITISAKQMSTYSILTVGRKVNVQ